jgi:hypothetical protein
MPKPSALMNSGGKSFSWLATSERGASMMSQRQGESLSRRIAGILYTRGKKLAVWSLDPF